MHGHDVKFAVELLVHSTSLHEWRRGADIRGRLVRVVGQGRMVGKHSRDHLELTVGNVLENRYRGQGGRSTVGTGRRALRVDDGKHRRVGPADGAADGGGEDGDRFGRGGKHLGPAEVEHGVVIAAAGS